MTDDQWAILQQYPAPWRVSESGDGKVFIYAHGQKQPIFTMHVAGWNNKRREALLTLISDAINHYTGNIAPDDYDYSADDRNYDISKGN